MLKKFTKKYFGLITQSKYDEKKYFKKDQPYPDQLELSQKLHSFMKSDTPWFCGYRTPPSSGKTTLVVGLAHLVHLTSNGNKQIIYCCYNQIVRKEVLKMLLAVHIPFSYGEEGIIKPHRSCYNKGFSAKPLRITKELSIAQRTVMSLASLDRSINPKNSDKRPYVIVLDLETTIEVLKDAGADDKYVLFIDEPTAGLENGVENNKMAEMYTEIMYNVPKYVIATSATLPDFAEIPEVVINFCGKYMVGEESLGWVTSSRLGISCLAVDKNGYARAPHHIVKNYQDLDKLIKFVKARPFLAKFYTPPILVELCDSIPKLPSKYGIKKNFPEIGYITHDKIRKCCLDILEYVVTLKDNELIANITKPENRICTTIDDTTRLFTDLAHEHLGSNLIVTDKPHEYNKNRLL